VSAETSHEQKAYSIKARLPQFFRYAALALVCATVVVLAVGIYKGRAKTSFKLKSEHAQLSTEVIAEVSGYERLETENGQNKYFIRADHAKTFSDNHQELQNVYLEVFAAAGGSDKMTAESAIYIPEEAKNFTAYLKGNVHIDTRDGLKVKTGHIVYTKAAEVVDADEAVEFERQHIRGRSDGAHVRINDKRVELLRNVEIETFDSPEALKSNVRYAKLQAGSAVYDQHAERVDLDGGVIVSLVSAGQPHRSSEIKAARANARLVSVDRSAPQVRQIELFDNVHIVTVEAGSPPTEIRAGYALYDRGGQSFELKRGAHIVTNSGGKATDIRSNEAFYEQAARKAALFGSATVTQGQDEIRGDTITAQFFDDNKLREAIARGNASARQVTAERTASVFAPELNASFASNGELRNANAAGGESRVEILPAQNSSYSELGAVAARGIGMSFKGEGLIEALRTDGRTTVHLNAPAGAPDAAHKKLTADGVTTSFHANGKDIRHAEAVGNAELYVEPLVAAPDNYRTTITAPKFTCDFFSSGNNVRACDAGKKAKVIRVPTLPSEQRGTQTLTADQLDVAFDERTRDVDNLRAIGDVRFIELDRTAIARQMTFSQRDQIVRLRGGEPTVWNQQARAKAAEIDWDVRNNRSALRGSVSTTYYSRKQTRDSAPFTASDKPVFLTAASAELDHAAERGVYRGNSRAWQEDNFVRAETITVEPGAGKFTAEGGVQSALYDAKVRLQGKTSTVPTFATARSMTFDRATRVLSYRENVDIRQGSDRIVAGSADVYLSQENEVSRTVAQNNVVITQPGRRAAGEWVQYTADDESAILRGSPATVTDTDAGSSQSAQIAFNMRERRVVSGNKASQASTGRNRTVYKVRNIP
jgi:LPS export ABC transporter protein LptC